MTLSRPMALVVGALSAWPVVYFVGFLATIAVSFGGSDLLTQRAAFEPVFRLHLLTMFVLMGLLAFHLTHAFRSPRIVQEQRVLWLVVLFMGNMLAFPVYWYLHVWRR